MSWEKVNVKKPHHCELPYYKANHPDLDKGDVIRCTECQQHYMCTGIFSGMQWDPTEPTFEWTKVEAPIGGYRD